MSGWYEGGEENAGLWNWWPWDSDVDYVGDREHIGALALCLSAIGEERSQ